MRCEVGLVIVLLAGLVLAGDVADLESGMTNMLEGFKNAATGAVACNTALAEKCGNPAAEKCVTSVYCNHADCKDLKELKLKTDKEACNSAPFGFLPSVLVTVSCLWIGYMSGKFQ